jgi:peptidyl-prolyl cis-trans isomerase SurA
MNLLKYILSIVFITSISCNYTFAQQKMEEGFVIDKIVAIVGNEIIMQSDIAGKLELLRQQDRSIDVNNKVLQEQVLESLINENLIITKAIEDSIVVTEDEISTEWDRFKDNLVNYYGSTKRIEDVYGMSLTRIQYEYREIIRKQLLAQKIQQKKFYSVKVTPKEVEDFFNLYKDSIPDVPTQFELYHLVKFVGASKSAKEEVYELAKKVRDSIISGGLFSDFAKRYSQDPGSATDGGELGWFSKGKLLPEFEKAAFELIPGKTSMPIETPFGYHIIQTLDKNKDSVMTRHILFRIGNSQSDIERTKDILNGYSDSVKNGADFIDLAKMYSDDNDTRGFGGALGSIPEEQLPPNFKEAVVILPEGGITDPLPYNVDPSKPAMHIIYKKKIIPAHKPNLDVDFKILEQKAKNFKQMNLYNDWIQQLRKELYWEVKDK